MLRHIISGKNRKVLSGRETSVTLSQVWQKRFMITTCFEVSSFQLKWFAEERVRFHLSVINLGEDHLDYHRSIDDYFKSKTAGWQR